MVELSVIIITKNEENCIRQCLESVTWADQIVVVDSGSTDRTVAICREYTDHVVYHEWPGSSNIQKNYALDIARGPWVLCIDADEVVSPKLRDSILRAISSNKKRVAYKMLRRNYYRNMPINFGSTRATYELRLFLKDKGRFIDRIVHDRVVVDGKRGRLSGYLEHYNMTNLDEWIEKNVRYCALSADQSILDGRSVGLWDFVKPLLKFLRQYILRQGFLHGSTGLVFTMLPICYRVITAAMIWDRRNDPEYASNLAAGGKAAEVEQSEEFDGADTDHG